MPADDAPRRDLPSPPLVAAAGWLLPGAGYWLIGQRTRALTVFVTIIVLFLSGILLGGVRSVQVPGYGEQGGRLYIVREEVDRLPRGTIRYVARVKEHLPGSEPPSEHPVVTNFGALLGDIGNKPWSICQVMTGPVAIAAGAWSIWASRPQEEDGVLGDPRGVLSHSRINEIAVLYTAVAGMLNLLVIIDAAARAGAGAQAEPTPRPGAASAPAPVPAREGV